MAYNMALQYDGKLYSIVIPPEEYRKIEKDPSLVAKYWELLNVHQTEGKTLPKRTPEDGAQAMYKNEIDKSYWDVRRAGHMISLVQKYDVDIYNPESDPSLWNKIEIEMNAEFPMSSTTADHCLKAFQEFLNAHQTIKSDEENSLVKGEIFTAIERVVQSRMQSETNDSKNNNVVIKGSETEGNKLGIKSRTNDLTEQINSSLNNIEKFRMTPASSKDIVTEEKNTVFKVPISLSNVHATIDSIKLDLAKCSKKRSRVGICGKRKKTRRDISMNPESSNQTSISCKQVKSLCKNSTLDSDITSSNDEKRESMFDITSQNNKNNKSHESMSETNSPSYEKCGSKSDSCLIDELHESVSGTTVQRDNLCKTDMICSCRSDEPPQWFNKFEKQFESKWDHLAKVAQEQISVINELVGVLSEWVKREPTLQSSSM